VKVTYFYNFLFGFFSKTRARGGVECRKGCQGIPINLHMLIPVSVRLRGKTLFIDCEASRSTLMPVGFQDVSNVRPSSSQRGLEFHLNSQAQRRPCAPIRLSAFHAPCLCDQFLACRRYLPYQTLIQQPYPLRVCKRTWLHLLFNMVWHSLQACRTA